MDKFKQALGQYQKEDEEWGEEERSPAVRISDQNGGRVRLEFLIPGLEPGKDKYSPKGGKIDFHFHNDGYSFTMEAKLTDKAKKMKTTWAFAVEKLPTRINTDHSKWDVEEDKIFAVVEKDKNHRDVNWSNIVFAKGLDQKSSSDDSS